MPFLTEFFPSKHQLSERLVNPSWIAVKTEIPLVSPIRNAYDPAPNTRLLNHTPSLRFPVSTLELFANDRLLSNAIKLYPHRAGLPLRSSLKDIYESRYWEEGLVASVELLKAFGENGSEKKEEMNSDDQCKKMKADLKPGMDIFNKLTMYMLPFCDGERGRLLSLVTTLIFIYDDIFENISENEHEYFHSDFVSRLDNVDHRTKDDTHLQQVINSLVQGLRDADRNEGNGGKELIQTMRECFKIRRAEPPRFQSIPEYLTYRSEDIACSYAKIP